MEENYITIKAMYLSKLFVKNKIKNLSNVNYYLLINNVYRYKGEM